MAFKILTIQCSIVVSLGLCCIYYFNSIIDIHMTPLRVFVNYGKPQYSTWPAFTLQHKYSKEDYTACFTADAKPDIEDMLVKQYENLQQSRDPVCLHLLHLLQSVYGINSRYSTPMMFPVPFQAKVNKWLNNDEKLIEQLNRQHLIHVRNHLTGEHVVYNPVRSHRPIQSSSSGPEWLEKLAADSLPNCDFCDVYNYTASDEFGRHATGTSVRVSNTFKMEHWHAMVVTHQHHPVQFTKEVYTTLVADAVTLAEEMVEAQGGVGYPHLGWDILPKAGASQLHPHIHVLVPPDAYYGYTEQNRQGAEHHYRWTGRNLFTTMVEVHHGLGLAVTYGNAVALALLSGKGDLEVMVMSAEPGFDLYSLMYFTTKAYQDSFDQYCYTKAVSWSAGNTKGTMPAIARLIGRGDCTATTSDFSGFDIYQAMYRSHDPWVVVAALREAVAKYGDS